MSEKSSEPDIRPRRFNVAEVPEAVIAPTGQWRSPHPDALGATAERLHQSRWLFGRLSVEVLGIGLCVSLAGVHYAISMVWRGIERVELHRG